MHNICFVPSFLFCRTTWLIHRPTLMFHLAIRHHRRSPTRPRRLTLLEWLSKQCSASWESTSQNPRDSQMATGLIPHPSITLRPFTARTPSASRCSRWSGARLASSVTGGAGMMAELSHVPLGPRRGPRIERRHRTVPSASAAVFGCVRFCKSCYCNEPRPRRIPNIL